MTDQTARPDRELGTSGLRLSRVGLGSWAMGGPEWVRGWGDQDDADSIATVHEAAERGINWVDTAPAYGRGHAESVIGRAIADLPEDERPYVFTKCGLLFPPDDAYAEPRRYLDPDSLRAECDESLRLLGVERIDLMQIHWPPDEGASIEECWGAMQELIADGKVRAAGVSNFSVEQIQRLQVIGPVVSVQPPFSLIRRDATEELLPWCAQNQIGALTYSPMQSGLLTGRFSHERLAELAEDDWRRQNKEFQEPRFSRNLELAATVQELADARGVPPAVIAIAATLAWPAVTGAIVGARRPEQIDGWLAAAWTELSSEELATLRRAIERTGAGSGPSDIDRPLGA